MQGATIEEACELTANMYLARPRKSDIRPMRDSPLCDEAEPIIYLGLAEAMGNIKY